jgi:hypothetical protein
MKTVEIEGKNPEFAAVLKRCFKDLGYGEAAPDQSLDMFVYIIDAGVGDKSAYGDLLGEYQSTALKMLERVAAVLPRLEKGSGKRLCFVNKLSSSINLSAAKNGGFERVVLASCNMGIKTLFNRLRPAGFTFRLYGVDSYTHRDECSYIAEYCVRNRSLEKESPEHSDENRLIMRDRLERECPW